MNWAWLRTAFVSALPVFELRGGIPWGILREGLPWHQVLPLAVAGNLLPVAPIYFGILAAARFCSRWKAGEAFFGWLFRRTRRRAGALAGAEFVGLVLFVGIPLPITGAWTGTLASVLLGVPARRALPAIGLGVLLAAGLVSFFTVGLERGWDHLSPFLVRLFLRA